MIKWEFKKLIKSKGMIISLAVLIFTLLITSFIKPVLETENSYLDDKEGYVQDTRDTLEIANEKFHMKISVLEELSEQKITEDNFSKTIASMSKEKISNLKNSKYEDVGFWQVFNYRATNPLINISMLVIIMIIISNLYTDEIISSVKDIILSSKKRNKALNSKIIMSLLIPIVVYSVYLLGIFTITYIQKGAPINGELEAFRIVDNITILNGNPTIMTYILSNIKIAFLMFEGWAVASMLFSFISVSSISSISMPGAILSVFSYGNYYDLIFNFNNLIGSYMGSVNILGTDFGVITLVKLILVITFTVLTALCFVISRTKYINR